MTDCSNFTGKIGRFGKTVSLHKLPSNLSLKRAWIIAISRKNWRATNYTRVCSDHFKNGIPYNCFGLMTDSAVVDSALVDAALRKSGLISNGKE